MQVDQLDYIERMTNPILKPEYAIIWLHGLGADYNDFTPIVSQFKLTKPAKFIFPNASLRPITINNGYVMRAWYDIYNLFDINDRIDKAGILHSVKQIEALIDKVINQGIVSEKIFLGGFSQGGVISYTTGLLTKHKLAGIIALSCYLPDGQTFINQSINQDIPIFAAHGVQDTVVPYAAGLMAYEALAKHGFPISWHEYLMMHSVCNEEIDDLAHWINSKIN